MNNNKAINHQSKSNVMNNNKGDKSKLTDLLQIVLNKQEANSHDKTIIAIYNQFSVIICEYCSIEKSLSCSTCDRIICKECGFYTISNKICCSLCNFLWNKLDCTNNTRKIAKQEDK